MTGIVVPVGGVLQVTATQAGVVAELLVQEGQSVSKGQPIARILSEHKTGEGDAVTLIAEAMAQRKNSLRTEYRLVQDQAQLKLAGIQARISSLENEEGQALAERDVTSKRVELSEKTLLKFEELARAGYVSLLQVQSKQEELLDLQQRKRSAERVLEGLRRDRASLKNEELALSSTTRTALTQLDRALASLDQELTENGARRNLVISSPIEGVIATISQQVGQTIQNGQSLLTVAPALNGQSKDLANQRSEITYEIQLYGTSRTTGFIDIGDQVFFKYDAYPFEKFGMASGIVRSISTAPIAPQDLPAGQAQALLSAAQSQEPLYRVTVSPTNQYIEVYGDRRALRPGMTIQADVLQEHRRVWEWFLDPLLSKFRRQERI